MWQRQQMFLALIIEVMPQSGFSLELLSTTAKALAFREKQTSKAKDPPLTNKDIVIGITAVWV